MITYNQVDQNKRRIIPILKVNHQSGKRIILWIVLVDLALLIVLLLLLSGCSGPSPHRLQAHFESEPHGSEVIQGKLSAHSQDRLAVGMAIVLQAESVDAPLGITEGNWPQFSARVNHEIESLIPVSMEEVVLVDEIPSGEQITLLKGMGEKSQIEIVLVVLPYSQEVRVPAQFDLLPEVSMINGYQTENYAMVELGLLDLKSGKLLLQSEGTSYATLEQLDVPLASNRYPRVRGSAMIDPIYPEEDRAVETLRMVALHEALEQAVMKLSGKWHDGARGAIPTALSPVGVES